MSRNEWEEGDLSLPAIAVPAVRFALIEASNLYHARLLSDCAAIWRSIAPTTVPPRTAYLEALDRYFDHDRLPFIHGVANPRHEYRADLSRVMYALAGALSGRRLAGASAKRLHAPRPVDVDLVAPRKLPRASTFSGPDWQISLKGAAVHYQVLENGNARSSARAHPVVAAFFAALGRVNWTRGSGGVFVGNDDSNTESRDSGGGANYLTASFGPLGEQARASEMGISLAKYRTLRPSRPRR